MRAGRNLMALTLGVALLSASTPALAFEADRGQCVAELNDAEVMGRLAWVERLMHRAQRGARLWFWGWLTINTAVVAAGAVYASLADDPLHRDAAAWAAAGAGASLVLMITPPISSPFLMRRFHRMRDSTLSQRREKLDRSVAMLERAGRQEAARREWYNHAGAMTFAATESFYLAVRHGDRPAAAVLNGAVMLAAAETLILTSPRGASRASIDYLYGSRPCMAPQLRTDPRPAVDLTAAPGGLGITVSW